MFARLQRYPVSVRAQKYDAGTLWLEIPHESDVPPGQNGCVGTASAFMRNSAVFLATSSREPAGNVKFPAGQQVLSAAVDWETPLAGNKNRLSATPSHRDGYLVTTEAAG